jgi:hypothetical protein
MLEEQNTNLVPNANSGFRVRTRCRLAIAGVALVTLSLIGIALVHRLFSGTQ